MTVFPLKLKKKLLMIEFSHNLMYFLFLSKTPTKMFCKILKIQQKSQMNMKL